MVSRLANNIIGPMESISRGTLSSLFTKLEKKGLIEETNPNDSPFSSDRSSRVYKITADGNQRFYQLMMDTSSNVGSYQKVFHIKALHLHFVPIEDQLYLVNHYMNFCKKTIQHLEESTKRFDVNHLKNQLHQNNPFYDRGGKLILLKKNHWQDELTWTEDLQEEILTKLKKQT
jgi:DNA-binding PadR family transcriptional regulator